VVAGETTLKICVFGLWHLGTVISAGLAKSGHTVVGLDFNRETIDNLQNAGAPVSEPGLNELILENLRKNALRFTCDPVSALADTDVVWIAFDTPVDEQDNADPEYIEKNFDAIAGFLPDQTKIIISSQVPVGFTRQLSKKFHDRYPDKKVFFAYSPENLRLGKALKTFLEPDRIIIGTAPGEQKVFLLVFSSVSDRLEWMSVESAEMTKHAINAFLATSICFANEIATLCEHMGANAKDVERGLKTEERIGPKAYLNPGNAFSGGTLARDVRFLQKIGKKKELPMYLINSVLESNEFHKTWIQRKCLETMGNLNGKQIAVLGLTYKPGTNTLRRSASVELCRWLKEQGSEVTAFDPAIRELPPELQNIFSLSWGIADAVKEADCIIIATEWPDFQKINADIIMTIRKKIIIDPNGFIEKNMDDLSTMRYFAVGRSFS
jgi:UDPglucose 6-dehydrogenase